MSLSIIAAMDQNQVIGYQNQIPWDLPADLEYFKETTMGAPIIMGRKTFESIGSPLPGRENIIMTRDNNYFVEDCKIVHSYKEIINLFSDKKEEAFIIGGAEIYRLFLPDTDKLYLTIIENKFMGDTYFPKVNWENWNCLKVKSGNINAENQYQFSHYIYQRKSEN